MHGITIALAVISDDVKLQNIPYVHASDSSRKLYSLREFLYVCLWFEFNISPEVGGWLKSAVCNSGEK